jgi:hypothetical protein
MKDNKTVNDFKKITVVLLISILIHVVMHAQGLTPLPGGDGILVGNPNGTSVNNCDGNNGEAIYMNQDDNTGFIGIGTCTPYINSNLTITNFGTPANSEVEIINTYPQAAFGLSVSRVSPPTSGVDLAVSSSGLVGIGVVKPQAHIDITDQNLDGLPLIQATPGGGNTPAFIVVGKGLVGINTATPSYPLDVNGGANFRDYISVKTNALISGAVGIGTSTPATGVSLDVQNGAVRIGNVSTPNSLTYTGANGNNGYGLYVQYGVLAESFKCALYGGGTGTSWSDYVFDKDYKLKPLTEVETYIKNNHHLPDVPSTDEVECEGIDMAKMDATLLKKIEELTLYMLHQQKEIETLKVQLSNTSK